MICAEPTVNAVTLPESETIATAESLEPHLMMRPVSTFPAESRVVAVAWVVWPTFNVLDASVTLTDATGVMPLPPILVTVMVALPL
jgi:hypothetical protein